MNRDAAIGFADLLVQIKITNRLLAAQLKGTMKQNELIQLLAPLGASNKDIADILGTTAATVANAVQRQRKKGSEKSAPQEAVTDE